MLGNFIYSNPTKLYFGDEAQKNLVEALSGFGKKVMLTYGGGSIKRNGIYDDVIAALNAAGKEVVELSPEEIEGLAERSDWLMANFWSCRIFKQLIDNCLFSIS